MTGHSQVVEMIRTFVEKPESSRRNCSVACHGEEDGGLVGRTGKDHLVVASRTQEIGRVKPVRHPQPACASKVSDSDRKRNENRIDLSAYENRLRAGLV